MTVALICRSGQRAQQAADRCVRRPLCQTVPMTSGRSALICRCLLANTLATVDDCLCRH